jgi:hypothetical protein
MSVRACTRLSSGGARSGCRRVARGLGDAFTPRDSRGPLTRTLLEGPGPGNALSLYTSSGTGNVLTCRDALTLGTGRGARDALSPGTGPRLLAMALHTGPGARGYPQPRVPAPAFSPSPCSTAPGPGPPSP